MSDPHIELIARTLCTASGDDPDAWIQETHGVDTDAQVWTDYIPLARDILPLIEAARIEGAKSMQERAEKALEDRGSVFMRDAAAVIRALPLPNPPKEG